MDLKALNAMLEEVIRKEPWRAFALLRTRQEPLEVASFGLRWREGVPWGLVIGVRPEGGWETGRRHYALERLKNRMKAKRRRDIVPATPTGFHLGYMAWIVPLTAREVEELYGGLVAAELTSYARKAFSTFRGVSGGPAALSEDVALAVGAHAARVGISRQRVERWLGTGYGSVWVRESGLVPGLDLKEVRAAIRRAMEVHGAR